MGKRKIGEIYNKPIVEGDKNLVTNNEIHKSELSGEEIPSGRSNWRYFDIQNINTISMDIFKFFTLYKFREGTITVWGSLPVKSSGEYDFKDIIAIAVDEKSKLMANGQIYTFDEVLMLEGFTFKDFIQFGATEITEEEFYSIN